MAVWVFIHSLHLFITMHRSRNEKAGHPSTVGPFTAHTPMFCLWSVVEVTLLSTAPKWFGFSSERSYREAITCSAQSRTCLRDEDCPPPEGRSCSRSIAGWPGSPSGRSREATSDSGLQTPPHRAGRCCVDCSCSSRCQESAAERGSPTSRRSRGCRECCTTPSSPTSHSTRPSPRPCTDRESRPP